MQVTNGLRRKRVVLLAPLTRGPVWFDRTHAQTRRPDDLLCFGPSRATAPVVFAQRYRNERNLYGGSLQKAIKQATSVDELLDMVADNESFIDHIHATTAVYKMAKLVQKERKGRGGGKSASGVDLLTDQRFEVLKAAIESQINKFDSWVSRSLFTLFSFSWGPSC